MCDVDSLSQCTPKKWFDFMGDAESEFVPFEMNYITDPISGLTPFNRTTVACNESVSVSVFSSEKFTKPSYYYS